MPDLRGLSNEQPESLNPLNIVLDECIGLDAEKGGGDVKLSVGNFLQDIVEESGEFYLTVIDDLFGYHQMLCILIFSLKRRIRLTLCDRKDRHYLWR